jgi:hypothetical protein
MPVFFRQEKCKISQKVLSSFAKMYFKNLVHYSSTCGPWPPYVPLRCPCEQHHLSKSCIRQFLVNPRHLRRALPADNDVTSLHAYS